MFELRPYQKSAVDAAVTFFRSPKTGNAIEVLPTGSGKSLIIANIVKELNEPILIFQPTKEILEQNIGKLRSYGYEASIFSASLGKKDVSNITYATIGSANNKQELFNSFKYIIVDECHGVNSKGGMYEDFLNTVKAKVLGLTATPYRLVTDRFGGSILKFLTRTRPRIFTDVIHYTQNGDLFDAGYLAKLKYYPVNGFNRREIKLNSTGADYDEKSARAYYQRSGFLPRIVQVVNRLLEIGRKNVIVFTRFVEESQFVVDNVKGAAIVTADTSKKDREQLILNFRTGVIKVVCNVGILNVGFDYPELETIVLAFPTMSLARYYQSVGRGMRPHPQKEYTMIVDMCGNTELFGEVETLRLIDTGNGKWIIKNKGKQLTNIYFER